MARPTSLSAMISYQSNDLASAELLHEELCLRGLFVAHDRCTFAYASRIPDEMKTAVETCDAFVSYLTPNSLYLSAPAGAHRPAIDSEFLPAMARRRRSLSGVSDPRLARPLVVPIFKGLGDRAAATDAVLGATGEDIGSLWVPGVDPTNALTRSEAADISAHVLSALLSQEEDDQDEPLMVSFASRGVSAATTLCSIDATLLLGGPDRRVGDPADWERVMRALREVEACLSRFSRVRVLYCRVNAHISAALLFGRVFNQAHQWQLTVEGQAGLADVVSPQSPPTVAPSWDPQSRGQDITVEIDLLRHPVFDLATVAIREHGLQLKGRLQIRRPQIGDLSSIEIAQLAADTAQAIREKISETQPSAVHLFCASPVEFAVLLGRRLTATGADLVLYERDASGYLPVLTVPHTV